MVVPVTGVAVALVTQRPTTVNTVTISRCRLLLQHQLPCSTIHLDTRPHLEGIMEIKTDSKAEAESETSMGRGAEVEMKTEIVDSNTIHPRHHHHHQ